MTKQRFLDETGLVVLRVHDIWDKWPEIGIRGAWAKGLGLTDEVAVDESGFRAVYAIEETTLRDFAQYVARKIVPLGEDSVQVIGDPVDDYIVYSLVYLENTTGDCLQATLEVGSDDAVKMLLNGALVHINNSCRGMPG